MMKLKSCPRCKKGDVTLDRDYYGWYEYCIQCGYARDAIRAVELEQHRDWDEKRKRVVTALGKGK